jgi:voltage-gated potassium channel
MIFLLLAKKCKKAFSQIYEHAWLILLITLSITFICGFVGMEAFGEKDVVSNYVWWFFVTVTTVGYGDVFPITTGGRLIAGFIMIFGIGAIAIVIGKLSESIITMANKKNRGLGKVNEENHTVLMGYRKGSTEKVIDELFVNNPNEKIVLCSAEQEDNPVSNYEVEFIKGELASVDVLSRACVSKAENIVVHGSDDNQTFITAYAVRDINKTAHMVSYLNNEDHVSKIKNLPAEKLSLNQVILPVNIFLMAQELQDRESSGVIQQLITNFKGENLYRFDIPVDSDFSTTFKNIFFNMKLEYGALAIAIKNTEISVNPNLKTPINAGMAIFYTAPARITDMCIDKLGAEYEC